VELCENLSEGGTTPSYGSIAVSREKSNLDVFVLIRPRGGDFVYSEIEFEVMRRDVQSAAEIGADGIVIGCLEPDGRIDIQNCSRLMGAARGLPVTFHHAFDITPNPLEALEIIKSLGIHRILTSGQKSRAEHGIELIRELHKDAGTSLVIMAGSGIDETNIQEIASRTGIISFHASVREDIPLKTDFGDKGIPFNDYQLTSAKRVKELIKLLEEL
jgi:copper homeostasis protein